MQIVQSHDPEAVFTGAFLLRLATVDLLARSVDRRDVGKGLAHERQISLGAPGHGTPGNDDVGLRKHGTKFAT